MDLQQDNPQIVIERVNEIEGEIGLNKKEKAMVLEKARGAISKVIKR